MIEVKRPELLNASLGVVSMLHPTKGTLKLSMDDVSEATLTLEDKAESIAMHQWVKIYNQLGFVGYFRRTSRGRNIGNENSYTLKHGIDILQDSIWDAETDFTGTKTEFITAILNKQTSLINGVKPWVLGSCADTSSVTKEIKYDNLMELLKGVVDEGGGYYLSYNQSVWPWQVSLVAKPSNVESEFRLERNMERCQIKDNDAELCTRLILNINKMVKDNDLSIPNLDIDQNASIYRTYNNTTAQANYGIIVKTADIDVTQDTFPSGPFPEADAFAADFLARRAEPMLQVEIDGLTLKGITGSDWDESKIATQVRVALPDYATAIAERCVTVTYPDLFANPERVTVSLANALPTFTRSMSKTQTTVTQQSKTSRSSARQAKSFDQHFKLTDDSGNVLQQAGMHLDANGLLVYADDNVNMVGARFNVQADKIGMVVGTNSQGNYIKAGEIALSINATTGQSLALINADHINISATSTVHTLAGEVEVDSSGNFIIKNGAGLRVRKTVSGHDAEFGIYDENNLTAGVVATIVNGQTSTHILGSSIYIGNNTTVATWISGKTYLDDVTANYISGKIATLSNVNVKQLTLTNNGYISLPIDGGQINVTGANCYDTIKNLRIRYNENTDTYTLQKVIWGTNAWSDVGSFERGGGGDVDDIELYANGQSDIVLSQSEPQGVELSKLVAKILTAIDYGYWVQFPATLKNVGGTKYYKMKF